MPTLPSKGRSTQNLPAKDIEELTLTPLLLTGSLVIWTRISCPFWSFGIAGLVEFSELCLFWWSPRFKFSSSSSSSTSESSAASSNCSHCWVWSIPRVLQHDKLFFVSELPESKERECPLVKPILLQTQFSCGQIPSLCRHSEIRRFIYASLCFQVWSPRECGRYFG